MLINKINGSLVMQLLVWIGVSSVQPAQDSYGFPFGLRFTQHSLLFYRLLEPTLIISSQFLSLIS